MFFDFAGRLDLSTQGAVMGGTAVASGGSVPVQLTIDGAPGGTAVRAVQYAVHGNRSEYRRRAPIRKYEFSKLNGPVTSTTLDFKPARSYVRFELLRNGQVIAFSNPLWIRQS